MSFLSIPYSNVNQMTEFVVQSSQVDKLTIISRSPNPICYASMNTFLISSNFCISIIFNIKLDNINTDISIGLSSLFRSLRSFALQSTQYSMLNAIRQKVLGVSLCTRVSQLCNYFTTDLNKMKTECQTNKKFNKFMYDCLSCFKL